MRAEIISQYQNVADTAISDQLNHDLTSGLDPFIVQFGYECSLINNELIFSGEPQLKFYPTKIDINI